MTPYVLAIDIGTTSVKAIAMEASGNIFQVAQRPLETLHPQPNHREQQPEAVLTAVIGAVAEARLSSHSPLALVFSSAMHSLLAVDGSGKPLSLAIIWSDTRSTGQAEALKNSDIGALLHRETGTPVHPMAPLSKLVWMQQQQPQIFEKSSKFVSLQEWILFRCTEEWAVNHSMASATGLFNIFEKRWHEQALQAAHLTPDRLSKPVSVYTSLSLVASSPLAEKAGLSVGLPVFVGASDGCLANVGTGAIADKLAAVTIGTSGAVRKTSKSPRPDEKQQLFNYLLDEAHYVTGGAVNNGGNIIQWFSQEFLKEKNRAKQFPALENLAKGIRAGADGLLFLPYVFGERAPFWDAKASGTFLGLRPHHTQAHMAKAVFEGVLLGVVHVADALRETAGDFEAVRASGGFAQSSMWVQMLADMLQKPVEIAESHENSAIGAAFLAFKALGYLDSWEDVAKKIPVAKVYQPNAGHRAVYAEKNAVFQSAYSQLHPLFNALEKG